MSPNVGNMSPKPNDTVNGYGDKKKNSSDK